ncbi:hypothetical protein [Streptomyces sp. TRM68416]|uniref:hypothetical protein n=1 Tax=Streptomyces sp. TRM68416 TaxID=2758412 RepID=UPI001661BA23|nr:hypothetical protein [Streptomyces sp. TRM68416]MBD0844244.1 hypothetical protein [Streptomyces sp. TRM68416]
MSSAPEPPRLHVVDLTAADGEAVLAFLAPRLRAQMDAHYGTETHKTASALDALLRSAEHTVRHQSQALAADSFHDGRARLRCLHALQDAWNTLWRAVFPWRDEEGYDHARWVHVEYHDAEDAARYDAMKAEVAAELDAEAAAADPGADTFGAGETGVDTYRLARGRNA